MKLISYLPVPLVSTANHRFHSRFILILLCLIRLLPIIITKYVYCNIINYVFDTIARKKSSFEIY